MSSSDGSGLVASLLDAVDLGRGGEHQAATQVASSVTAKRLQLTRLALARRNHLVAHTLEKFRWPICLQFHCAACCLMIDLCASRMI